jgi:hypothetical protein
MGSNYVHILDHCVNHRRVHTDLQQPVLAHIRIMVRADFPSSGYERWLV